MFSILAMKIADNGKFIFIGMSFSNSNLLEWAVPNYSLLFNYEKKNIEKRKTLMDKERSEKGFGPMDSVLGKGDSSLEEFDSECLKAVRKKKGLGGFEKYWLCYKGICK
jgi:hypothetical protein